MEKPTEYTLTWTVTDEMTAKRIGGAGSKILSTPNMVALMEAAALGAGQGLSRRRDEHRRRRDSLPPSCSHPCWNEGERNREAAQHRAA